jgi:AcrR family transcriptional regulator
LISSATALVEEEGLEAFTLREVARRVGVSHTAPYRHFADKQVLLAAVAEKGFAELGAATRAAFEAEPNVADGFLAVGQEYIGFAVTRPVLFRLMYDPSLDESRPTLTDAKEAAFGVLLGAVAAAQQSGVLRKGDLVDVAITAWAAVHGLAQLAIDRALEPRLEGVRALDEWADTVTRLVLAGIGATIEQPSE